MAFLRLHLQWEHKIGGVSTRKHMSSLNAICDRCRQAFGRMVVYNNALFRSNANATTCNENRPKYTISSSLLVECSFFLI